MKLVVPFAAGGTTDAVGRVLAHSLGERLGQQVVVENRSGGGGTLGSEVAARSTPDGYTLLLGSAETFGMTDADAGGSTTTRSGTSSPSRSWRGRRTFRGESRR